MKHFLLKLFCVLLLAACAVSTFTSCDSPGRLASRVAGEWSGAPMRVDRKLANEMTLIPVFRFQPGSKKGGEVTLLARVSVMMPVNAPIDSTGVTAVSATASGLATVRGTWRATDDDEIDLAFDPATIDVTMDPDVEFELADVWTSNDVPTTRTVSEAVRKAFVKQMSEGFSTTVRALGEIDDIRLSKPYDQMSCKFLKHRQTLKRL